MDFIPEQIEALTKSRKKFKKFSKKYFECQSYYEKLASGLEEENEEIDLRIRKIDNELVSVRGKQKVYKRGEN